MILVLLTLFTIWAERRVVARMQQRIGPNRVGPLGLLQSLMDGIKLALKEDIIPKAADKAVFILAPIIATIPAFLAFAVIPFGPEVSIFGHRTPLQLTDFPVAVLYVLAIASVGIYGIVLAGWSCGSTYPLLGGLRSTRADDLVRDRDGPVVRRGVPLRRLDVDLGDRRRAGRPLVHPASCPCRSSSTSLAMVGETNRAPFDLPEAEGELVGGFHTEYSSLKFALFFLAEYINMVTVSALATTLFLGGWRAPWPISLWSGANTGWWPLLWFFGKVLVFIFVFIWLRGTLPRLRYDQFMKLGWKVLIPVSLVWIVAVAAVRVYRAAGRRPAAPARRRRGGARRRWSLLVPVPARAEAGRDEDDDGLDELDWTTTTTSSATPDGRGRGRRAGERAGRVGRVDRCSPAGTLCRRCPTGSRRPPAAARRRRREEPTGV